jgi:hypothetical protein
MSGYFFFSHSITGEAVMPWMKTERVIVNATVDQSNFSSSGQVEQ